MQFHYSHATKELVVCGHRLAWEPGVGTKHCRYVQFPGEVARYQGYEHWCQHLRSQPVLLMNHVPKEHLPWLTQHTPFHYSYLYNNGMCTIWCMHAHVAHTLIRALDGGGGWSEGRPTMLQVVPEIYGGLVSSSPRPTYNGYLELRPAVSAAPPPLPRMTPLMARKDLQLRPLGRPPLSPPVTEQSSKKRRQLRRKLQQQRRQMPSDSGVKSVLIGG